MNLTLRDIQMVKTIEEEGNLTRAAERLFVSQSALSHQLKKIESELGTSVFRRLNKNLVITPSGKRILESSEVILAEINKMYLDLQAINQGMAGTIRISTECYTCYHWLPPIIKAFREKYPDAEIQVVHRATRQPMDYLKKAQLDVAIVSDSYDSHEYESTPLFSDEMLAVLSEDHPLANKTILNPEDFNGQTMVLYDVEDDNLFFLQEFIKPNGIELKQVMKLELTEAIVEMIAAGLGIGIMANWAVSDYLESKRLVTRPISKKPINRVWYATALQEMNQPLVKNFIQFLEEWYSNQADKPVQVLRQV
ncbi:LysR family transcriptional regulator [bacterium SCSIO 12741]|nr:LysR family transcriptional regulator [bacterium SCSIO 12741]